MKSFASVFGHPESHGPQICAIHMISAHSESVSVLFRNVGKSYWKFPANTKMIKDGKMVQQDIVYKKNTFIKIYYFVRFTLKMFLAISKKKYDLIVLFDPMAFFSYSLIAWLLPKSYIVWYHNYDAIDLNNTRKYTLGWFANRTPCRMFPKIDFFTLPMKDRVKLFPVHLLKRKYQIIPNYSLLELHSAKDKYIAGNIIFLVYVGTISNGHGFEEIIEILKTEISGKQIHLILKGFINDKYKNELLIFSDKHGVRESLTILPSGPWKEVPEIIRKCHIGLAIYTGTDQMNMTLGKGGSGKVYQYIAEGLPVLMNTNFHKNFNDCNWAISTELNQKSLEKNIFKIVNVYNELSKSAAKNFMDEYNCNIYFDNFFKSIFLN